MKGKEDGGKGRERDKGMEGKRNRGLEEWGKDILRERGIKVGVNS